MSDPKPFYANIGTPNLASDGQEATPATQQVSKEQFKNLLTLAHTISKEEKLAYGKYCGINIDNDDQYDGTYCVAGHGLRIGGINLEYELKEGLISNGCGISQSTFPDRHRERLVDTFGLPIEWWRHMQSRNDNGLHSRPQKMVELILEKMTELEVV